MLFTMQKNSFIFLRSGQGRQARCFVHSHALTEENGKKHLRSSVHAFFKHNIVTGKFCLELIIIETAAYIAKFFIFNLRYISRSWSYDHM